MASISVSQRAAEVTRDQFSIRQSIEGDFFDRFLNSQRPAEDFFNKFSNRQSIKEGSRDKFSISQSMAEDFLNRFSISQRVAEAPFHPVWNRKRMPKFGEGYEFGG